MIAMLAYTQQQSIINQRTNKIAKHVQKKHYSAVENYINGAIECMMNDMIRVVHAKTEDEQR